MHETIEKRRAPVKRLLILGAGTAGTMMANHLRRRFSPSELSITIVDRDDVHLYQPGLLFIPFGRYSREDVVKTKTQFIPKGVGFLVADVDRIEPGANHVVLKNAKQLPYDILIIATGSQVVPGETPGLLEGGGWRKDIHDFYTLEGSLALGEFLKTWKGGRLVVHIKEMPIKCPVAPLEFAFLADAYFRAKGIRDKVEMSYVTPLPGAFTKPKASQAFGSMFSKRGITLVPEFDVEQVNAAEHKLVSFDGREVSYDLLVTIPTHMGDPVIERSGLGDELGFVPTHPKTLQSKTAPNIFVIGDATNIQASKAGSVAHFEAETLIENVARFLRGEPLVEEFDGHSNCFIESGHGKAILIDFNTEIEPLPGTFPLPGIGPFSLLKESRLNHWGKLAFRWIYWNVLLRGWSIPLISARLSTAGKELPVPQSKV